jgi:hypothetical protein
MRRCASYPASHDWRGRCLPIYVHKSYSTLLNVFLQSSPASRIRKRKKLMPLFKNFDGMKQRMGSGFVEGGNG